MPKLVLNAGTAQARGFELKPGSNYVGRAFSNDFKIEDPSVSSNHAQIVVDGDVITLKDLGSTNGTFINRSQVREGFLQPRPHHFAGQRGAFIGRRRGDHLGCAARFACRRAPPRRRCRLQTDCGLRVRAPPRAAAPPPHTTINAPPPPGAPAPGVAAPVAGLVEPPKGKTACKFHRNAAGQWLCQQCNELFCSLCVTTRRTDEGPGFSAASAGRNARRSR